jgi:nicotinamidase-related amidase
MSRVLILIDFINEFLHPDGKIAPQGMGQFCEEHGTIQNARRLIDSFRSSWEEIVWVRLGFHEDYSNCSHLSPRFKGAPALRILRENTWSTEFLEELDYRVTEKTFTKTRVSPFYQTGLEAYLREKWIAEIIIAGVATDLAVSSIARDAHDRDIECTVISDACATISIEHHEAGLVGIAKIARIITASEYLQSK